MKMSYHQHYSSPIYVLIRCFFYFDFKINKMWFYWLAPQIDDDPDSFYLCPFNCHDQTHQRTIIIYSECVVMFHVNPNNLLLLIDILTHSFNQQHMNTHKYVSFDTILTHKRTHSTRIILIMINWNLIVIIIIQSRCFISQLIFLLLALVWMWLCMVYLNGQCEIHKWSLLAKITSRIIFQNYFLRIFMKCEEDIQL